MERHYTGYRIELLGDCAVLRLRAPDMEAAHATMREKGYTHVYDDYIVHVTLGTPVPHFKAFDLSVSIELEALEIHAYNADA